MAQARLRVSDYMREFTVEYGMTVILYGKQVADGAMECDNPLDVLKMLNASLD